MYTTTFQIGVNTVSLLSLALCDFSVTFSSFVRDLKFCQGGRIIRLLRVYGYIRVVTIIGETLNFVAESHWTLPAERRRMSDDKRHSSTDCPTSPQRALEENSDIAQEAAELFRPLQVEDSDLRVTSIHQVIHRLYDLEQDQPVDEQADSCKLSPGGEEHNGQNEDSPDAADGKVYRGIERLKALIPTSVRITCEW